MRDFPANVVITAGHTLHDAPVAEHALALVLAAARRLNLLVRAQVGHRWAGEFGGRQPVAPKDEFRTLRGARVTIWGFGGIAGTLAPHLNALGATVTGIARNPGERHGFPVVTTSELPDVLPQTDVLIMILPGTPETERVLGAPQLALLPAHAWLVNVGRGSTVDEVAMLDAIRSHRLAGAALDVFDTEPLPSASALWDEPNVIITPHAAGGRPIGASELIRANLKALMHRSATAARRGALTGSFISTDPLHMYAGGLRGDCRGRGSIDALHETLGGGDDEVSIVGDGEVIRGVVASVDRSFRGVVGLGSWLAGDQCRAEKRLSRSIGRPSPIPPPGRPGRRRRTTPRVP